MKNVIALVNLHNTTNLGALTNQRPIASTTFLGRYTFIDFALSNLTNSGIDNIGILVKDHSRSIIKHLGSESTYLKNPKTGFQSIFINEAGLTNPPLNTDINNLLNNDWILYERSAKYILIVPTDFIYKVDFNKVIDEHIASNRVVSVLYTETHNAHDQFLGCDMVTVDALNNIQKFEVNRGEKKDAYISLETYVFNVDFLREVLKKVPDISMMFSMKDLLHFICNYRERIHAIKYSGYCRYFSSLKEYKNFSFELLDNREYSSYLFSEDWRIYTTTHNSTPVSYGENCDVKNSLLANGCKINGKVKHSILARNVIVEEGAEVIDSIVFTDTIIKSGCVVKNCVIDKYCTIQNKKSITGSEDEPIYIPQGAKI